MRPIHLLAADLGASGGKLYLGSFDGERITLEKIHGFSNGPVLRDGVLCWDTEELFRQLCEGLLRASRSQGELRGVSVDSWGQDFVLVMQDGGIAFPQRCYRGFAGTDSLKKVEERMPLETIYERTGTLPYSASTLAQIAAMGTISTGGKLLFTPDYLHFRLCGGIATDPTIASTSMLLGPNGWDREISHAFGLEAVLPPLLPTGTVLGECALPGQRNVKIITGAGHDSACAFAACPGQDQGILVSGTWSLLGVRTDGPVILPQASTLGFTNQRAADGRNRFLRSFSALWLLQQCVLDWGITFAQAEQMALAAPPGRGWIRPGAVEFFLPGRMPQRINDYLRRTGQPPCRTKGAFVRCIYESLALEYARTLRDLSMVYPAKINGLTMTGGGTQSQLLCQLTADATGLTVQAGSRDGSALGNCLAQLVALGELRWNEAPGLAAASIQTRTYLPQKNPALEEGRPIFNSLP